jgi:type I restriction enzyme S subunit
MSEWKKCKIGEMVTLRQGFAINAKSKHFISKEPTSLALLRIADMKSGSREIYIKEDIPQSFIANPCDIIYTRTGNVGLVFRNNFGVVHNNCFTVTPNDENVLSRDFLFYLLQSQYFFEKANSLARGAAQPDLPHSLFNSIEVAYPSLNDQIRIATILSRYDSLIENYQKQIKLLEEAAQRLYKEWFVELRFPGHENTKMVDGLPEGWERKKLGELTSKFATGLNPRKNFVLGHGNNYYVTIKNMSNNDVAFDEKCDKIDDEALEKINKRSDLQMGDLLFSGIGTIGRVYLIDKPVTNWNISESVFTMRPRPNIPSSFLYLVLLDKEIQDYCQSNAHGCAQKGIRMADLKAFEVLVPPQPILDAFNNVTSNLIKQVKYKSSQIRLLTEARDRLLPRLMGGEMEV